MQLDEIELLKKLLQNNKKHPVRVADFLLDEIEKRGDERQAFVNTAVLEKLVREQ